MVISGVKRKFPIAIALILAAGTTGLLSLIGAFNAHWVEIVYARSVFPTISHIASFFADAVPFSWLDLWIVFAVAVLIFSVRRRDWRLPMGLVSAAYLIFFWGWGLNYHRTALESRLGLGGIPTVKQEELGRFVVDTADSLNRLWPMASGTDSDLESLNGSETIPRLATARVRRVIRQIDGKDWVAASRIKHSYLADWWFRIAGIDGVFNPFAHEPILVREAPGFELPFLTAHELAHVHGIADEGDANFIAYLATVESDDPAFQYSGAFEMWIHVRGPVRLLDPGPRLDLETYYARIKSQEVPQAAKLQSAILDSHLKANGVHDGLASYSKFVALAIATRSRWHEFQ